MHNEGDILQLLYDIVKGSALYVFCQSRGGELYKKQRPLGRAGKVDIVVSVVSGSNNRYQKFIANVNIYISDINAGGEFFEDTALAKEVQTMCSALFEHIDKNEYFISYLDSEVARSFEVRETHEHFINNKLKITIQNF